MYILSNSGKARIGLVCLAMLIALSARADPAAAWAALRQGGHVGLMRHADAPGAAGDPPGFRLEECGTQRNLSAKGAADAAGVGAALRREGVAVSKLLSSPWCRCLETARLMGVGPVEVNVAFSNAFVLSEGREALRTEARAIIDSWKEGTLLVVTHGANIQALTGEHPASGEIFVLARPSVGPLSVIGRIPVPDR